jgi:hypothetical protein
MLDDQHRGYADVGLTALQSHQRTSPFFALLLDIQPSYHCCNYILSALVSLSARNLP